MKLVVFNEAEIGFAGSLRVHAEEIKVSSRSAGAPPTEGREQHERFAATNSTEFGPPPAPAVETARAPARPRGALPVVRTLSFGPHENPRNAGQICPARATVRDGSSGSPSIGVLAAARRSPPRLA